MAKDDEKKPTAADKGKGKAVNGDAENKEVKKDKDGKPIDDKKGAPAPGMCGRSSYWHSMATLTSADGIRQRNSAKRTSSSRTTLICW
jgi:hypothetical protein